MINAQSRFFLRFFKILESVRNGTFHSRGIWCVRLFWQPWPSWSAECGYPSMREPSHWGSCCSFWQQVWLGGGSWARQAGLAPSAWTSQRLSSSWWPPLGKCCCAAPEIQLWMFWSRCGMVVGSEVLQVPPPLLSTSLPNSRGLTGKYHEPSLHDSVAASEKSKVSNECGFSSRFQHPARIRRGFPGGSREAPSRSGKVSRAWREVFRTRGQPAPHYSVFTTYRKSFRIILGSSLISHISQGAGESFRGAAGGCKHTSQTSHHIQKKRNQLW